MLLESFCGSTSPPALCLLWETVGQKQKAHQLNLSFLQADYIYSNDS